MTRARQVLRITESAIALPKVRRGEVLIMHVDDFAKLLRGRTASAHRAAAKNLTLTPQAIHELAPLLRAWINGLPNTVHSERETVRDYFGRVLYTTAGEANRVWRMRQTDNEQRALSAHGMGELMLGCGFERRLVKGVDGLKVYRYYTPMQLMDPR